MRILSVVQNSKLSDVICEGRYVISQGKTVWKDSGKEVVFPIKLSDSSKTRWIPTVYGSKHTFDELCRMFPECVRHITEEDYLRGMPSWGCGWYTPNEQGFAECLKDNWDSSD